MKFFKDKQNWFDILSKISIFLGLIINIIIVILLLLGFFIFLNLNSLFPTFSTTNNEKNWSDQFLVSKKDNFNLDKFPGYQDQLNYMKKLKDLVTNEKEEVIDRGILLYGPPGNGKTYLVKCLHGSLPENVPFYNLSATDFQNKYVGVAPDRVKNLFYSAKEKAEENNSKYYFIFIDEIEIIAQKRSEDDHSKSGAILNQLLTLLDGFSNNQDAKGPKSIVIGATNREELLDTAITRPGRLGTKIEISYPNQQSIKDIVQYYTQKIKFQFNLNEEDLNIFSQILFASNFTSAKINELFKKFADNPQLTSWENYNHNKSILYDVFYEILYGPPITNNIDQNRKNLYDDKRKIIYIHELGHAFFALKNKYHIERIDFTPRNNGVQGFVLCFDKELITNGIKSKESLLKDIQISLGGRIFEEISGLGITIGSSDDLSKAYQIAYQMVSQYGFNISNTECQEFFDKIKKKFIKKIIKINTESSSIDDTQISNMLEIFGLKGIKLQNYNIDYNIHQLVLKIIFYCYIKNLSVLSENSDSLILEIINDKDCKKDIFNKTNPELTESTIESLKNIF